MKSITQKDNLCCGIACVAFICKVNYETAKRNFFYRLGNANKTSFICKNIVKALNRAGKKYNYKYLKKRTKFKKNTSYRIFSLNS